MYAEVGSDHDELVCKLLRQIWQYAKLSALAKGSKQVEMISISRALAWYAYLHKLYSFLSYA